MSDEACLKPAEGNKHDEIQSSTSILLRLEFSYQVYNMSSTKTAAFLLWAISSVRCVW
jgi:hypothetical protein